MCYAWSLSCVQMFVTPWTIVPQDPLSMGILQARILEWDVMLSLRGSSQPSSRIQVSYITGLFTSDLPAKPSLFSLLNMIS